MGFTILVKGYKHFVSAINLLKKAWLLPFQSRTNMQMSELQKRGLIP